MMTKREKKMFFGMVILVLVFVHVWGVSAWLKALDTKDAAINQLSIKAELYQNSPHIYQQIEPEMQWLRQYQPEPKSFGDAETQLLNRLQNEGRQCGLQTEKPQFIRKETQVGNYRKATVEISAVAKEAQVYKWIIAMHKPTELRAITQIKLRSYRKDKAKVACTLVAEQWMIEKEL